MVAVLVIIAATPLFVISGAIQMENWIRVMLIVIGLVVIVIGIAIACILDRGLEHLSVLIVEIINTAKRY